MTQPKRLETVLIVMPVGTQRGGGELMLEQLLRWSQHGPRWVVVFLEDGPMLGRAQALGAEAHLVQAGRMRQPLKLIAAAVRIARLARDADADLVLGWMTKGQVYGSPAAIIARRPAVWYQLGNPRRDSLIDRLGTALPANGVVTLSRRGSEAQAQLWPRRRQAVVYPGAELDAFDPDHLPQPTQLRERLGIEGGPVIGIAGRLQSWKGFHTLIEALPAIRAVFPDAQCVLVGGNHGLEPEYPDRLRRQVEDLGLADAVTFAGYQANVAEWMQAMDVVVHASADEPFGIVVIEAMALGKPVVAGSSGGPREIITDGVNGQLVDYEDARGLSDAIIGYLTDPEHARVIGRAARERAADFAAPTYARSLVAALKQLT